MSSEIDTIYNEHIANEKLKMGTKYERLAAVVFKALNQDDVVVHDLTLRGEGKKTGHQIDVTVQKAGDVKKRILIECKDYDKKVGIDIVRDFFGAVHQIKPDEAIVVTTEGYTRGARSFAEDEGIKLALLRGVKEEDLDGRIMSIKIEGTLTYKNTPKITNWVAANVQELEKFNAHADPNQLNKTSNIDLGKDYFYDQEGRPIEDMYSVLNPIWDSLPTDPNARVTGRYEFGETKYVYMAGVLVGARGFDYEYTSSQTVIETVVDQGNKVAILIFKMLDGEIDKIIFDQDLDKWTFNDDGKVTYKKNEDE